MKPTLTQEQRLTWKMSQRLSQAIEILQYNGEELLEFLEQHLQDNPLLKWDKSNLPISGGELPISGVPTAEEDLYTYLKDQLLELSLQDGRKAIVEYGIDSLNENGYLDNDLEQWQQALQVEQEQVQHALSIIQSLEPAGVGARSLQECIVLQLQRKECPSFIEHLVEHHLEWIADDDRFEIMQAYEVNEQEAREAIEAVKRCHPRPGLQFAPIKKDYIVPDATIYHKDGRWHVDLSYLNTPSISIDQTYANTSIDDVEAQTYIQDKYRHANWIVMAIEQRKQNVLAIIEETVHRQVPFLESGPTFVQPLRMREIAFEVDLHVSTVSRAIRNKYVQTPHGIYPLKFFFQQGVKSRHRTETSSYTVKQWLKELIEKEDKNKPYSDQKLRDILEHTYGAYLSRRTVAKYREEMLLPSSTKRRSKKGRNT
ncbi:RNA polymerase factor sigma-54 [Pontibacillus litoralis]|uniref:RNA polymerase subunit sigma-54 n=1 Tax=Pontibacillus litoralis JSM 072002 TaxID=1385512 RepID=A0A0A5G557_9BACI|nr:RNA polymerase factor sigma-54 [Pontibacillus litoralis]KGX86220.1 RNA polymerase subunit sigma-54 [Pontibacillus litoralis JSM 072002]